MNTCYSQNTINEVLVRTNWSGIHCRGTNGICSINDNKQQANTKLIYKENTLTFIIDRAKLSATEVLQIVREPLLEDADLQNLNFIMEDDFIIDPTMQNQLKINNSQAALSKGVYPVQITDTSFIIVFNLQ